MNLCICIRFFFPKPKDIKYQWILFKNEKQQQRWKIIIFKPEKKTIYFHNKCFNFNCKKKIQQNRQNQFNSIQFKFLRSSSEFLLFFLIWKKNKHKQTTYRRRRRSLTGNIDAHIHSLTVIHSMNITSS